MDDQETRATEEKVREYLLARGAEEKWIELSHGRSRYLERPGDGPPVVLVHGYAYAGGADRLMWLMPHLAHHYHVYAIDLLGWGMGDRPKFEHSSAVHIVDSLGELLDALQLPRVHLVGHCFGARMALNFTYQSPHRVMSVVAAAVTTRASTNTVHTPESFKFAPSAAKLGEGTRKQMGNTPGIDYEEMNDWRWRNHQVPGMTEAFRKFLSHIHDPTQKIQGDLLRRRWAGIDTPILLVWADAEPTGPLEDGLAIHAAMPSSRLVKWKGNHFFPQVEDAAFAELVMSFLDEHSDASSAHP